MSAAGSSANSSELSSFHWFLEHVLELLLECENVEEQEMAMAGIFDAMATCAFRESFVPLLISQFKQATTALEQLQKSSRYH